MVVALEVQGLGLGVMAAVAVEAGVEAVEVTRVVVVGTNLTDWCGSEDGTYGHTSVCESYIGK